MHYYKFKVKAKAYLGGEATGGGEKILPLLEGSELEKQHKFSTSVSPRHSEEVESYETYD